MSAVPQLRFSEFTDVWAEHSINQLLENEVIAPPMDGNHGEIHPKSSDYVNSGIPFVMANDLIEGKIALKKVHYISEKQARSLRKGFALVGDVLLSHKGSVGEVAYIDELNTPFAMLTPQVTYYRVTEPTKLYSKYLFTFFVSSKFQRRLKVLADGGTRPYIGITLQKKLTVDVPSLPEQKKIADFLGAVDDKIAALRERERLLTDYKKGVMQKIFTQAFRFKADDGSDFPDWELTTIGSVYEWIKTNSLSRANLNYESGEVKNIHYGDIHTKFSKNFRQEKEDVPFISSYAASDFSSPEFCQRGDVVFADASEDYNDIGKAIEIVELGTCPLVAGLHTYIARPRQGFVAIGFSSYLFQSWDLRYEIMRIAQGISVLGISKTNMERIKFQLPHPYEQQKIADFLSAIDDKITAVSAQIIQMQDFKKGLLQQMFV